MPSESIPRAGAAQRSMARRVEFHLLLTIELFLTESVEPGIFNLRIWILIVRCSTGFATMKRP